ncbi:hypothetical protein STEG23_003933, partial [Scotinomys teguina]
MKDTPERRKEKPIFQGASVWRRKWEVENVSSVGASGPGNTESLKDTEGPVGPEDTIDAVTSWVLRNICLMLQRCVAFLYDFAELKNCGKLKLGNGKCKSTDECKTELCYTYTMDYYPTVKKNEVMKFT